MATVKGIKALVFLTLWLSVVVVGVILGRWQLDRLAWKTDWLARIDQAYTHPLDEKEFLNSKLPCTSRDRTFFVRTSVPVVYDRTPVGSFGVRPRMVDGMFGQYVFTRATLPEGASLWVNRGFVAEGQAVPPPSEKSVLVTMQVRASDMTDAMILDQNRGITGDDLRQGFRVGCDPLAVVGVLEPANTAPYWPRPVGGRPDLPNNHLHYAIFWFFMSGIAFLMGIWMILRYFKAK